MHARAMSAAAATLAADPRRLTKLVIEQLEDPALFGDSELEGSIEMLLERFCLSLGRAKPVGLEAWASREGTRLGAVRASEIAGAVAQVLASEATHFDVDHGRVLAFLEILKSEISASLALIDDPSDGRLPFSETTHALLAMLGERDSATCCHSWATGEWARRLCEAMRLGQDVTNFIALCAILHDIGKISTPEGILLKEGPLSAPEWEVMRDHSAAGQRILDKIPSLRRCSQIVRGHHERWDGAGYPDGLAAENIPFEARVVAVADAFHAMISDRPYRRAITPRQALAILSEGRGTQWDPHVVDTMLGLFHRPRREQTVARASTA